MRLRAVVCVVVLAGSLAILYTSFSVHAAHGCAPSIPPPVTGSPTAAPATPGIVVLNEILLNPQSRWNCTEPGAAFSSRDAWIELYNPQNQAYNLFAAHATIDSGPGTNPYYMPLGAAIAAHGFLVVFPRLTTTFVMTETSTVRLLINEVVIDQVKVPTLAGDQSYARVSDGGSKWQITATPTIDASNNSIQATPTAPATSSSSPGYTTRGNGGSTNTDSPLATGTQPAWAQLQLPGSATPPATATQTPDTRTFSTLPSPATTTSPSSLDNTALLQRIMFTVLLVLFALALFWCWRLFKRTPS